MRQVIFTPIGIIHTPYKEPAGTPIQVALAGDKNIEVSVDIFPEHIPGLKDLDGFSHIILIYQFHRAGKLNLLVTPYLDNQQHGVFATRAPARPNSIGISVVRLVSMNPEGQLLVRGIDILDGTPLLDIKPYIPAFDSIPAERTGWLGDKARNASTCTDDGRFSNNPKQ